MLVVSYVSDSAYSCSGTATIFVYLTTAPCYQGYTEFPELNINVKPVAGMALLFPNILENGEADPRTVHLAHSVPEGSCKLGLNLWVSDEKQVGHVFNVLPGVLPEPPQTPRKRRKADGYA